MAIPARNKRKASSSPEPPHNLVIPSSSAADNLFSPSTQPFVFPPGYKFVPKDEELFLHFLKPFSQGNAYSLLNVPIHHVNIYESNPQQLSENFAKGNEKEWFFVLEIAKLTKGGRNTKRGDNGGYWHTTTAVKKVNAGPGVVGYKSNLEYYVGKPPNSVKGDWLMQEYSVESTDINGNKVCHALCKIYLNPKAAKKKKAEEEEKEKPKKEESLIVREEVEQMDLIQPDQSEVEQMDLYQPNQSEVVDDFSALIDFEEQSEDPKVFWTKVLRQLDVEMKE